MTMQHGNEAHKEPSLLTELVLVTALVLILITMAAKYVW
jgi:hypothetical protein